MAERTSALTTVLQCAQPVAASSEYTVPSWLPTNTRPRCTAVCDRIEVASGNANTHFGLSRGTSAALSLASCADWNRALANPGLQPDQPGVFFQAAPGGHAFEICSRCNSVVTGLPSQLAKNSRSSPESADACC